MTQRLALCRALLHEPALARPRRAPLRARRRGGGAARRRARRAGRAAARSSWRRTIPSGSSAARDGAARAGAGVTRLLRRRRCARAQGSPARAAGPRHAARDGPLRGRNARRLPLRAPGGAGDDAAYGLLWVALVFTALLGLGRAWAPESEAGALDGLVLAAVRPQHDLAREDAGDARVPRRRRARALSRRSPSSSRRSTAPAIAGVALASVGICAVGSLVSAMAAAARGREVLLPLLFLPLAIPLVVGGVGLEHLARSRDVPRVPRPLRRRLRDTFVGRVRVRRHRVNVTR